MEDPQAAASYCVDYIPDCDSALPYSQNLGLPEVSNAPKSDAMSFFMDYSISSVVEGAIYNNVLRI